MNKKILIGVLSFVLISSGLFITLGKPTPTSATVSLPTCLSDKTGLSEFDAVTNNTELVARLVYAEAFAESQDGKRGVSQIVKNRAAKNLSEFGGSSIRNVVLNQPGGFVGMQTSLARCPQDVLVWNNSWLAAEDPSTAIVSVGTTLWFNTNSVFGSRSGYDSAGYLVYTFPGQSPKRVMEKVVIGNHTFFRVAGY